MIAAASAEVTQIPERIALTIGVVVFVAFMFILMRRGWLRKISNQSAIAQPNVVPVDFEATTEIEGRYLASTLASDWLNRIAVHGLGLPARGTVRIGATGLVVARVGSEDIFIPTTDVIRIRADRAIAGRAFEKDGIAIITWKLGETFIDSGFRADHTEQHIELLSIEVTQESAK